MHMGLSEGIYVYLFLFLSMLAAISEYGVD